LKKQIFILTGKVHSGKTTGLIEWLHNKDNAAGIISPVINSERQIFLYPDYEYLKLEANENSEKEILLCGKYKFFKDAFIEANNYFDSLAFENLEWVIIDEAGLLELNDEGLHDSVKKASIKFFEEKMKFNLIIIVRDYLVGNIIDKYNLGKCVVIDKEELKDIT
jgi:nucleoside-triphosphatase THEP1